MARGLETGLETLQPGKVGIYCCGPTVYDMSHIGHARAALAPDIIVRTLRFLGYQVTYVRNITDIDDKIIVRAQEQGIPAAEIAARYTAEYHRDLTARPAAWLWFALSQTMRISAIRLIMQSKQLSHKPSSWKH